MPFSAMADFGALRGASGVMWPKEPGKNYLPGDHDEMSKVKG